MFPYMKDTVKEINSDKIVILPAISSLPFFIQKVVALKSKASDDLNDFCANDKRYFSWDSFVKSGALYKTGTEVEYEPDRPLIMVYSSGTTGASKGIVLTNDGVNAIFSKIIQLWKVKNNCTKHIESYRWDSKDTAIILSTSGTTGIPKKAELSNYALNSFPMQSKYVDVGLNVGSTMLTVAPPFVAYGISATVHMPLCNGVCVILAVNPDPKFVAKQFFKFKPNLFMCGPAFVDEILKDPQSQNMDCSFVSAIQLGGEAVAEEYLDKINTYLKNHNSRGKAFRGYAMTESSSCCTSESKSVLKPNSVGIPLCDVTVKVVDNETGQELPYGHEGELISNSPTAMNKYFGNDEETLRAIVFDDSGNKWIKSGDLAKIDEDGFIYIVGRIKRMALAKEPEHNSMVKLFPDYVEHLLSKYDKIEKCAVIVAADDERGNVPIAYVKVKDGCKVKREELDDYLASQTGKYNIPKEYYFINSLPLLPNGKIDYRALEKEAEKQ